MEAVAVVANAGGSNGSATEDPTDGPGPEMKRRCAACCWVAGRESWSVSLFCSAHRIAASIHLTSHMR